ncbi:MAG: hypothetical protein ACD_16C00205G0021 [uncultured bacterium]|nr:MAG: hypothetical protein ACD_16C00205G0021 [uncultured bacterium]OFW68758.1 MAG: preprotein translocase subunit YajC [Alphaproteobacteria bacterium GWC2_42_16]OFW73264.1 MAG: preprotein translocase subunit YajC [Alphaproteobacteria bacterium GWA2_41_27]OFW81902.1 MAG: preprotein translocase subunit YajC [Alphaproteobacteria bacterium RIFCSPHIGHO2_12_FULL_42_100]OFW84893.1 MAG: preprotein translocase subunit YajC [Alphaproteobacteria bacterium RBG_16_42_14]OFW91012.1 MAG: preprotein translo
MTLFDYLISPAQAQAAASPFGFDFMSLLPLLLIFVVFYFLLIRPQQKKAQEHKAVLSSLRRGDRVVTSGGIIGTITKVIDEQEVQVEIAEDVKVRVARPMISSVLARGVTVSESEPRKEKSTLSKLSSRKTLTSQKKVRK